MISLAARSCRIKRVAALVALVLASSCAPRPEVAQPSPSPSDTGAVPTNVPPVADPVPVRGQGGDLRILLPQAPTTLNPHRATSPSDVDASRLVLEPLAALDERARPVARLAAEIPTTENGGISSDLATVTWKLKQGVKWSDGSPFSSVDVVLTHKYMCAPESGATTFSACEDVGSVTAPDPNTVVVAYNTPRPIHSQWGVGRASAILQWRQYKDCVGAAALTCPADQGPIGTGPYSVREFKAQDSVTYEVNETYRDKGKPYFTTVIVRGSPDAITAARSVFETGETDLAPDLRLDAAALAAVVQGSDKAVLLNVFGSHPAGVSKDLRGVVLSSWDSSVWNIADWYR